MKLKLRFSRSKNGSSDIFINGVYVSEGCRRGILAEGFRPGRTYKGKVERLTSFERGSALVNGRRRRTTFFLISKVENSLYVYIGGYSVHRTQAMQIFDGSDGLSLHLRDRLMAPAAWSGAYFVAFRPASKALAVGRPRLHRAARRSRRG